MQLLTQTTVTESVRSLRNEGGEADRQTGLAHKPFPAQLQEKQDSKPQREWRSVDSAETAIVSCKKARVEDALLRVVGKQRRA